MSIQSSINTVLGTAAFSQRTAQKQNYFSMQRQQLQDADRMKKANEYAKNLMEAVKQQKKEREKRFNEIKSNVKGWETSLGKLKDLPENMQREIIRQTPELKSQLSEAIEIEKKRGINNGSSIT